MKDLSTATRIGTDADYLNGNLIDSQTLLDTTILQDMVQFFQKIKEKANIIENDLFDNETNGYQLVEALLRFKNTTHTRKYEISMSRTFSANESYTIDFPNVDIGNSSAALYQPSSKIGGIIREVGTGYNLDGIASYGFSNILIDNADIHFELFSHKLTIQNKATNSRNITMQSTIWLASVPSSDFQNDGVKVN